MGCLNVSLTLQGGNLGADVSLSKVISASAAVVGKSLLPQVTCLPCLSATIREIASHIKAQCSVICELADVGKYLDVTPVDIQWITDDLGVFFDIESNVEWVVSANAEWLKTNPSSGNGDAAVNAFADTNEGIDREASLLFEGEGITSERIVAQLGKRLRFRCKDGLFLLKDGGTFNVLKDGLQ